MGIALRDDRRLATFLAATFSSSLLSALLSLVCGGGSFFPPANGGGGGGAGMQGKIHVGNLKRVRLIFRARPTVVSLF